jgi:DNA-directed RNA polymerase subunit RPC12/RpoP
MEKNGYRCANCGGIFIKGRSDEEAMKEYEENFEDIFEEDEVEIVCDDCYKLMMAEYPIEKYFEDINRKALEELIKVIGDIKPKNKK